MVIVIAAPNPWTLAEAENFSNTFYDITIIKEREQLSQAFLEDINPEYIFFPHWSWHIPAEIYENFNCVVFHPTDLPFGRGGTPIQNLIERGFTETVISAIKVSAEIDAGDVYLKVPFSLLGGGEEILLRMQHLIFHDMLPQIVSQRLVPQKQLGMPTVFKRRNPGMSELSPDMTIAQLFNHIRMLDIENYPKAFIRVGDYKFTFSRPALRMDGIHADVQINKEAKYDNNT